MIFFAEMKLVLKHIWFVCQEIMKDWFTDGHKESLGTNLCRRSDSTRYHPSRENVWEALIWYMKNVEGICFRNSSILSQESHMCNTSHMRVTELVPDVPDLGFLCFTEIKYSLAQSLGDCQFFKVFWAHARFTKKCVTCCDFASTRPSDKSDTIFHHDFNLLCQ